ARIVPSLTSSSYSLPVRLSVTVSVSRPRVATPLPRSSVSVSLLIALPFCGPRRSSMPFSAKKAAWETIGRSGRGDRGRHHRGHQGEAEQQHEPLAARPAGEARPGEPERREHDRPDGERARAEVE